jgi:hypothetical protein
MYGSGYWGVKAALFLIAGVVYVALVMSGISLFPKDSLTQGRMITIKRQILAFEKSYDRLPVSLDELMASNVEDAVMPFNDSDANGQAIEYVPQTNGVVLLKSPNLQLVFSTDDTDDVSSNAP